MRCRLEYGRTGLEVQLPDHVPVQILSYKDVAPLSDPRAFLQAALDSPLGTPPLSQLAAGRRDACILICDITRPVPNELILRPILATLAEAGIPRERICLLVATGLHRGNTPDELREMVGAEIARNYRIENHDGQRLADHEYLGDSPRGVPIWLDRRYVQADLKITTGLIEPHLMAGFSGGRKVICPGIAALETVKAWHSPAFLEHPRADCGILEGNPVHEENTWIAQRAGCDFIVNAVIDSERRPLHLVAGDMLQAFEEGVRFVRNVVTDTVKEPADVVVTSAAGYPLDATFYQTIKGMTGALPVVKHGGTIVVASRISEGIGSPEFEQLFRDNANLDIFMQRILGQDYFIMDQWQLEEMAKVLRKARVKVVTEGLSAQQLEQLFVEPASSVEKAIGDSLAEYGPQARLVVIPKGPYVLAQVA